MVIQPQSWHTSVFIYICLVAVVDTVIFSMGKNMFDSQKLIYTFMDNSILLIGLEMQHGIKQSCLNTRGIPLGLGYPSPGTGVSPLEGTWDQSLGYPLERTWDQWKYYGMEMGQTPPPVWTDRHVWKQYLPYPSDAGGKKTLLVFIDPASSEVNTILILNRGSKFHPIWL